MPLAQDDLRVGGVKKLEIDGQWHHLRIVTNKICWLKLKHDWHDGPSYQENQTSYGLFILLFWQPQQMIFQIILGIEWKACRYGAVVFQKSKLPLILV